MKPNATLRGLPMSSPITAGEGLQRVLFNDSGESSFAWNHHKVEWLERLPGFQMDGEYLSWAGV